METLKGLLREPVPYLPHSPIICNLINKHVSQQVSMHTHIILCERFCLSLEYCLFHAKDSCLLITLPTSDDGSVGALVCLLNGNLSVSFPFLQCPFQSADAYCLCIWTNQRCAEQTEFAGYTAALPVPLEQVPSRIVGR